MKIWNDNKWKIMENNKYEKFGDLHAKLESLKNDKNVENSEVMIATWKANLVPNIVLEKISRPKLSVPIKYSEFGFM